MNVLWTYISPSRISRPAGPKGKAGRRLEETGIVRLVRLYGAWKLLLLIVACGSPGPGYDTSTAILFDQRRGKSYSWLGTVVEYVVLRLTRWDAIYFASRSEQGHVWEQEWAFSWLLSKITSSTARVLLWPLPLSPIVKNALAGITIANVAHLLSVIVLYQLIYTAVPSTEQRKRQLAFTTACLHIISPAGLFLSAPYGESTFALLNFLGLLCYVRAVDNRFSNFADAYQLDACWSIAAGGCFALATMIRSNGLLSGLIFAWDVLVTLPQLPNILRNRDQEQLIRLIATVAAGALIAVGFAIPQAIAYLEYCRSTSTRPWCTTLPPSIYSFVQSHYWNTGFLRYWTLSNLPLFALAFPIGWLMVETALPALFQRHHVNRVVNGSCTADEKYQPYPPVPHTRAERVFEYILPRFALPAVVLVGAVAFGAHVQILNRLASGYPIWYLMLAIEICLDSLDDRVGEGRKMGDKGLFRLFGHYDRIPHVKPEWIVRAMMVYALVQAGLYSAFLPPA